MRPAPGDRRARRRRVVAHHAAVPCRSRAPPRGARVVAGVARRGRCGLRCDAQRAQERLGLEQALGVLAAGVGVGHDAAAGVVGVDAVARDRGADRDRRVEVARAARTSRPRRCRSSRGAGSSSSMISTARIFGAPVIEPPGNVARSSSASPTPARSVPRTVETMWCRVANDSHARSATAPRRCR